MIFFLHFFYIAKISSWLASAAQSDVHLACDQEVAGLIPAWSGNILSWRLIIFSTVIFSLMLIEAGQLSVSGKSMYTSTFYWIKSAQEKWLGKLLA